MQPNNFAKLHIHPSDLSLIYKAKGVVLPEDVVQKLASMLIMLIFTVSGLVILAVSVVFLAAESLVSAVLSQAKTKKGYLHRT